VSIDVTVVVPVYNPGSFIDRTISSFLAQSLPVERREFIFVDDGSTDGTRERLEALAAEHADIQVISIPNSGWPGKPRNVGMDAARGDYVYFCDHDDTLGVEALERMVAMARRVGSDVMIGKIVGVGRGAPRGLFRRTIERAELGSDPLMTNLTPHKMFRRSFLEQNQIRFPEGRRRLEDHVFVVHAYLKADVISVLADYVCYYHHARPDRGNAAASGLHPEIYFRSLEDVLDVIDANTTPGPFRNMLYRRPLSHEMLTRLVTARLMSDDDMRPSLFSEVRRLLLSRFPAELVDELPVFLRAAAAAARADLPGAAQALAENLSAIRPDVDVARCHWQDGAWRLTLRTRLRHRDGTAVSLRRDGDSWCLDTLIPPELGEIRATDEEVEAGFLGLQLRDRVSGDQWRLPCRTTVELTDAGEGHTLTLTARARIEPGTLAAGGALAPGRWEPIAAVYWLGWQRDARPTPPEAAPLPAFIAPDLVARPHIGQRLVVAVEQGAALPHRVARRPVEGSISPDGHLRLALDLGVGAADAVQGSVAIHRRGECRAQWPATVTATPDGAVLETRVEPGLAAGRYRLLLALPAVPEPLTVATLAVSPDGRAVLDDPAGRPRDSDELRDSRTISGKAGGFRPSVLWNWTRRGHSS
jgi:glycosyltransferase involved in cell wall biosynthesis